MKCFVNQVIGYVFYNTKQLLDHILLLNCFCDLLDNILIAFEQLILKQTNMKRVACDVVCGIENVFISEQNNRSLTFSALSII